MIYKEDISEDVDEIALVSKIGDLEIELELIEKSKMFLLQQNESLRRQISERESILKQNNNEIKYNFLLSEKASLLKDSLRVSKEETQRIRDLSGKLNSIQSEQNSIFNKISSTLAANSIIEDSCIKLTKIASL